MSRIRSHTTQLTKSEHARTVKQAAAVRRVLAALQRVDEVVLGESWYQLGLPNPNDLHAAAYLLAGPVRERLAQLDAELTRHDPASVDKPS